MSLQNSLILGAILALTMPLSAGCGPIWQQDAIITIRPEQKFQVINGWEAVAQGGQEVSRAFPNYRERLVELAVNDLGINRLRLELPSGAENPTDLQMEWRAGRVTDRELMARRYEVINDNADPNSIDPRGFQFSVLDSTVENVIVPMRSLLEKRGERLFVNLNFVDFRDGRGTSNIRHNDNPEEYAELMLAVFEHMNGKYGFVPDAIEVILEPDNQTGWTGTQIGRSIVATAKRLASRGFKPTFIAPSTTDASKAPEYIDEIANVPGAIGYISEFSYHRYCCASDAVLKRIVERAEKFGKQTAMLEWVGADQETLHQDLKVANNAAWEQYSLAGLVAWGPDKGESLLIVDDRNVEKPTVSISSRAIHLRQYFRYIRAGARRIGADTSNPVMDPVAFVNKDGGYVVVIKSGGFGTITVKGLPVGDYSVTMSAAGNTAMPADQRVGPDGLIRVSVPGAGVVSVFARQTSSKN